MLTICAVCKKILAEGDDRIVSHGYCRLHELEVYEKQNMLAPGEAEELAALRKCQNG